MSLIIKFIESIGDKVINSISTLYNFVSFSLFYILQIFNYHNYNAKTFTTLTKQIYHTSVTILPFFLTIAFIFGTIVVGTLVMIATQFGMQVQIGSLIINFVLNEFAPLFTAIFIALRSGTLIHKKLVHSDITDETNLIHIIVPRIISSIFSTLSLSLIFAIIMIVSGYIFTFFLMNMDLHTYKHLIFDAIGLSNITILLIKGMAFGFIVTIIAIYNGLQVVRNNVSNRTSVINMLVNIFLTLFFMEILIFLVRGINES